MPSVDQCEQIFHAALAAGDLRGVEAALTIMAVQDPHRAQRLVDLAQAALHIAGATVNPAQDGADAR
jgi:hypothetical protein